MKQKRTITNAKILIIGGAGFIGSNLTEVLLEQGNKVVCLDNFMTEHHRNIAAFLKNKNYTLIEGDIKNYNDHPLYSSAADYAGEKDYRNLL